jgi:hypothetical protein
MKYRNIVKIYASYEAYPLGVTSNREDDEIWIDIYAPDEVRDNLWCLRDSYKFISNGSDMELE